MNRPLVLFGIASLIYICSYLDVIANEIDEQRADKEKPPLAVLSANKMASLSEAFANADGWTGADAAWSVPVSDIKTAWLFGDTWIGKIRNNKHVDATMINNTIGIQDLRADKLGNSIKFFWSQDSKSQKASSYFAPDKKDTWFWPGSGAFADGRLLVVLHRIRKVAAKEPDFGFAEDGDVLTMISNPDAEPKAWKIQSVPLPDRNGKLQFGNACFFDNGFLYSYCTFRPEKQGMNQHPAVLLRLPKSDLLKLNMSAWQIFCQSDNGGINWQALATVDLAKAKPQIMFSDAAPEMSVSKVSGLPGYVAFYIPAFQATILMRHSEKPEGPWSKAIKVYTCNEDQKKVYVYAAKAHPELAKKPGEVILTYCRNTKFFKDQIDHSDWYAPQAVQLFLRIK